MTITDERDTLNELLGLLMSPERVEQSGKITFLALLPHITCADGFHMSVQASATHYCAPRDNFGPWHKVEVGYPNEAVAALLHYAEDKTRPTQTVYGFVPIFTVADIIDAHGGIAKAVQK